MTNLYEILGVAPGAEDAVVRAAYRTLMRTYHPDRNQDPQAQVRAREITAAFAILGDPEKRAAYDHRLSAGVVVAQPWPAHEERAPPMRNLALASIGVALAVSLVFALPHPQSRDGPQPLEDLTAYRGITAKPPALPAIDETAAPAAASRPTRVHAPAPIELPAIALPPPAAVSRPQAAAARQRIEPNPTPTKPVAVVEKPALPPSSNADRRAEVERLASGFLKQSLEHADWNRQQLLLSARNRSSMSRSLCRSDDCVTEAYLRQIRDTTAIMEGRIPSP